MGALEKGKVCDGCGKWLRCVCGPKVKRNIATKEMRAFWKAVAADAKAVRKLPEWKRAGVAHG